jgi:hypothetical protein
VLYTIIRTFNICESVCLAYHCWQLATSLANWCMSANATSRRTALGANTGDLNSRKDLVKHYTAEDITWREYWCTRCVKSSNTTLEVNSISARRLRGVLWVERWKSHVKWVPCHRGMWRETECAERSRQGVVLELASEVGGFHSSLPWGNNLLRVGVETQTTKT